MSDLPETPRANLYLIGFMGVGKSAVGRGVAKSLRYRFIDSDREIERAAGMPIADIFAKDGEAAFRQMEREFIERGHPQSGCVVACGGGLPIPGGMRELLLEKGIVICLFASEQTILERTARNRKRPLLNVENPEERIRTLLEARTPIYKATGTGICTDNRPLAEVIEHVVRVYRSEAARGTSVNPDLVEVQPSRGDA
jgi:shikimate kinase